MSHRFISTALRTTCVFSCLVLGGTTLAEDWSQFRGPDGNGKSTAADTPVTFSQANTAWQTPIPGTGWSSPVVSDGRIWLTTAETTEATKQQIAAKTRGVQFAKIKTVAGSVNLRAICVDAQSGKIIHNLLLREIDDPDLINPLNSYASPTPAIQGRNVICHFGSYGTWCLDNATGETLWKNALVVDHSVGPGSSPVIADNVVVIACDGIDKQFVAGLDLKTGKEIWNTSRPPMRNTNGEFNKAYCTPLLISVGSQTQAVIPGAQWICAYDPATGKEIWRADCGNGFSTTPMPVYESGLLVCATGFMIAELVAIDPKGTGDITNENVRWRAAKGGSTMPTAIGTEGKIYSISDNGVLSILDAKTGNVTDRIRVGGKFAASPLLVDGKLYIGSQDGVMSVYEITADGKPNQIAKNQMDGSLMASPAVIGSDLIVRTSKSLSRIRSK